MLNCERKLRTIQQGMFYMRIFLTSSPLSLTPSVKFRWQGCVCVSESRVSFGPFWICLPESFPSRKFGLFETAFGPGNPVRESVLMSKRGSMQREKEGSEKKTRIVFWPNLKTDIVRDDWIKCYLAFIAEIWFSVINQILK